MSSLPIELDFTRDPAATPARMDRAMTYLLAQIRIALARVPEYQAALDDLRDSGVQRLADALAPVVANANAQADDLALVYRQWVADNAIAGMEARILASFDGRFAAAQDDVDAAVGAVGLEQDGIRKRLDQLAVDAWFLGGC